MAEYPLVVPAIKVNQPLGSFFITKLSADILLEVAFTDTYRVTGEADISTPEIYPTTGAQRIKNPRREKEIAKYINTAESSFPNSIILSANYTPEGNLVRHSETQSEKNIRWHVEETIISNVYHLIIPTKRQLASIIDGQHRLSGFIESAPSLRKSFELICAVFIDLPNPYQAYLFSTINFNQKPVSKSLVYELFGVSLSEDDPDEWTPEQTAVFLTRRLNVDLQSPLRGRIKVAAEEAEALHKANGESKVAWSVSTATVVEGIVRLFSTNPKNDRTVMLEKKRGQGRSRSMLGWERSSAPLRELFVENNDFVIYTAVLNYFRAVDKLLWDTATDDSYIKRTVGIQALFDILRHILQEYVGRKDVSVSFFFNLLQPASKIDFTDNFFQASGIGRRRIRDVLAFAVGLKELDEVGQDVQDFVREQGIKQAQG